MKNPYKIGELYTIDNSGLGIHMKTQQDCDYWFAHYVSKRKKIKDNKSTHPKR